jgi:hypothetical protein
MAFPSKAPQWSQFAAWRMCWSAWSKGKSPAATNNHLSLGGQSGKRGELSFDRKDAKRAETDAYLTTSCRHDSQWLIWKEMSSEAPLHIPSFTSPDRASVSNSSTFKCRSASLGNACSPLVRTNLQVKVLYFLHSTPILAQANSRL